MLDMCLLSGLMITALNNIFELWCHEQSFEVDRSPAQLPANSGFITLLENKTKKTTENKTNLPQT